MLNAVRMIAANVWVATKADGTIIEWHQEDESAVTSKAEAVAMVQRTIDFWLPKLVGDISRNMPVAEAKIEATRAFRRTILDTLADPWPRKWQMTIDDFNFEFK